MDRIFVCVLLTPFAWAFSASLEDDSVWAIEIGPLSLRFGVAPEA